MTILIITGMRKHLRSQHPEEFSKFLRQTENLRRLKEKSEGENI